MTYDEFRSTTQVGNNALPLTSNTLVTGEKSSSEGSLNGSRQWKSMYFQKVLGVDVTIADLVPRAADLVSLQASPAIRVPEKAN